MGYVNIKTPRKEVVTEHKIELKPGETCPYCGQTKRKKKTMTEKQIEANQKNGKKGGYPKNFIPKNDK
jgi:predicted homoserine dehydrogenase-like protein